MRLPTAEQVPREKDVDKEKVSSLSCFLFVVYCLFLCSCVVAALGVWHSNVQRKFPHDPLIEVIHEPAKSIPNRILPIQVQ